MGHSVLTNKYLDILFLSSVGFISFFLMKDVAFTGDETAYWETAIALADFLKGSISVEIFQKDFVRRGFFMPGLSILLSPMAVFISEKENYLPFVRAYMIVLNLTFTLLIVRNLSARLGSYSAGRLFWLMYTSPFVLLFTAAIWADLLAALLAIYFALIWSNMALSSLWRALVLGGCLACLVYLRANYLYILPIFFFLVLFANQQEYWKHYFPVVARYILSLFVCIALILPWSQMSSNATGIKTITTTSLQLNQIIGFGDAVYVNNLITEGKQENIYLAVFAAVKNRAQAAERPIKNQYKMELKASLEQVNGSELIEKVAHNLRVTLLQPNNFPKRFLAKSCEARGALCALENEGEANWLLYNKIHYYIVFFGLLAFMVCPIRALQNPILGVFAKGFLFLLLLHPFVVHAHSRYTVQFYPLLALVGTMLYSNWKNLSGPFGFESKKNLSIVANAGQLLAIISVLITLLALSY